MTPSSNHWPPIPKGLTRREAEILPWLASDESLPKLAVRLGLSPETLRVHAKRIYSKLGASTRVGAVSHWLRTHSLSVTQLGDDPRKGRR